MPLYKRHNIIVSVLNECLGLYNKPTAEVHPGHKLTGPKEEEEEEETVSTQWLRVYSEHSANQTCSMLWVKHVAAAKNERA